MPKSKYEFVYTSGLAASGAVLLAQLGLSGLFDVGLVYRGWLYASLASNILAILCLLARRVINTYEKSQAERFRNMSGREMTRSALEESDYASQHPVKHRIRMVGRNIRFRSAKPIGWIGLGLVALSVCFYLIFMISNIQDSLPK